jgi:hypothetical protein
VRSGEHPSTSCEGALIMETSSTISDRSKHYRLKVSASDEESDGLILTTQADPRFLQCQLRSVRFMSAASVLLGVVSVVMMGSVALRPPGAQQTSRSSGALVGLSAVSATEEQHEDGFRGWYRTYLDSQVRSEQDLESDKIQALSAGSLVYIAEVSGRRAHILRPVAGWISMRTTDGVEIVRPDATYSAGLNKTDIRAVFQSRQVREATQRLQASAIKLTAVEKSLLDALRILRNTRLPKMANNAPQVGDRLAKHTVHLFRQIVKPEGVKGLLADAAHGHKKLGYLMDKATKTEDLMDKAKTEVKEVRDTESRAKDFEASLRSASKQVGQQFADRVEHSVAV